MIGLSLLLNNASLNLSVDLPKAITATLNLSEDAITQQLQLFDTTYEPQLFASQNDGTIISSSNSSSNYSTATTTHDNSSSVIGGGSGFFLHAPQYNADTTVRVAVLAGMAIASFIGNVATMWSITHQETYAGCSTSAGGGGAGDAMDAVVVGGNNTPSLASLSSRWRRHWQSASSSSTIQQNGAPALAPRRRRRRRRQLRRLHSWSAVYFLLFHLAAADLLVTAFCIVGEALWSYAVAWPAGVLACKGLKFAQMFSLYLSTFVLVLIGVDRWVAVKYPWRSLHMQRRCCRLVAFAYAAAAVLSVPQLFVFDVVRGPFVEEFHQCVTYGFYTAYWQEQVYTTFTLMCMFVVPLLVLVGTYVATYRTIAASERMFQQTPHPPRPSTSAAPASGASANTDGTSFNGMAQSQSQKRQQLIHRAKIKSLRISVVIVSAFIVCWSPYYVMMLMLVFVNPDREHSESLQSAIFCFGMSNSVVNPIVYGLFHLWPMRKRNGRRTTITGGGGGIGGTTLTNAGGGGGGTRSSFTKESSTHDRLLRNNGRRISDETLLSMQPVGERAGTMTV